MLTCVIPAWNEAPRIGGVLAAVTGHPLIGRVLVIDDGSTDGTGAVARAFGAEVLETGGNRGKTGALRLGLMQVTTPHVLLLDADLVGLTAGDVTALGQPVLEGRAKASVSLRGNAPGLWRMIGLDYISGERVLPMALLGPHLDALERLPRFGFEVFLNDLLIAQRLPLAVVDWPNVASPSKAHKTGGLWRGLLGDLRMLGDMFRTIGLRGCLRQIMAMRGLRLASV